MKWVRKKNKTGFVENIAIEYKMKKIHRIPKLVDYQKISKKWFQFVSSDIKISQGLLFKSRWELFKVYIRLGGLVASALAL